MNCKRIIKNLKSYLKIYNVLPVLICFLFGRIKLFGYLSPFGFCGAGCFGCGLAGICAGAGVFGTVSNGMSIFGGKYIFSYIIFLIINPVIFKKIDDKEYFAGASPALSIFSGGVLYSVFYGFSAYYIFINLAEALLVFFVSYLLDRGFGLLNPERLKKYITSEEIISVILIISGIICGTIGIKLFFADISVILTVIFMLFVCFKYGSASGAACGALCAFVYVMENGGGTELFPVLSLGGLAGGFLKGRERGAVAGVMLAAMLLLAILFNKALLKREIMLSAAYGCIAFFLLPDRLYYRLNSVFNLGLREPGEYVEQVYTTLENTLKSYACSFKNLGEAFNEKEVSEDDRERYNKVTDEVGEIMCRQCSLKNYCWDRNFYVTYDALSNMLMDMDREGHIDLGKVSESFKGSCMAFSSFVYTVEKIWEREELNRRWEKRIEKSRSVIKCYIESAAELLMNLSSSFRQDAVFDKDMSIKAAEKLREAGIGIKSISAGSAVNGRREILVTMRNCDCTKKNIDSIIDTINNETSENIMKDNGVAVYDKNNTDLCTIRFIGKNKFHIGVKVLREAKNKEGISGDNNTFCRMKDGAYLLALSDGMGSGSDASRESAASLDLFRDFISAGFSKETSIKLINSCLEFNSDEDCFATLDACIIDLYSGDCSLIKTGACPTYIIREGQVIAIKGEGLPVGILSEISPEVINFKLRKNDTVVMVTDGVTDSFRDKGGEGRLRSILKRAEAESYPQIAEIVFETAKDNYRGKILDDITVLTARIY